MPSVSKAARSKGGRVSLAKLAISRPLAVSVAFLIAVLIGAFSLTRLPIDLMPDISYPILSISTEYTGVGPQEIETLLTEPIEEAVSAVQGIEEVTSTSVEGISNVRLSFHWGTNLDVAADDVRTRLDRIRNRLPEDAAAPAVRKFDLTAQPIIFLAVSGDLSPLELRRIADDEISYRLERLPGVASVDVRGGLTREIRVEVDRQKLVALGLTLDQVSAALARENQNVAAGELQRLDRDLGLRVAGEFQSLDEVADTTVTARNGQPVRVRDLGKVVDTHSDVTQQVLIDGVPSLRLALQKQSGTNTVQVAQAVVDEVAALNKDLKTAQVRVTNDTSRFIRHSIQHITNDLLIGSALAALVLLFFLRNVRSTLIVTTAIPISVVVTFALLYFRNFSLNTMSLGGLALGIGRLVDDSIVVIENIYRHRHMGKPPAQAALDGTSQVSLAIVASTATTLAVFVPLIFLTGMTGVMFTQLSLVVIFSLSCSLIVAQGLIPLLASRFLTTEAAPSGAVSRRLYDAVGGALERLENGYRRSLDWALRHARRVVTLSVAAVLASALLVPLLGTEYMPTADEGEVTVNAEMAVGTPLAMMERRFAQIERIARQAVPEADVFMTEIGGGGARSAGSHTGSLKLVLRPAGQRRRSSERIANDLRRQVNGLAGVTARVSATGGMRMMRMGATAGGGRLGVQIRGFDLDASRRLMAEVKAVMEQTPGVADVRASREAGRPEVVIRVDRAKAAAFGIAVTDVGRALETAVLGRRATPLRIGGDEYAIIVRLPEEQRRSLADALAVPVRTASGSLVALQDVVEASDGEGPAMIERDNQERVVNVTGELDGRTLGETVTALRQGLDRIPRPTGFSLAITGDFEEQQKSFYELLTALGLALLLVFLVMVAQFESLKDPFVIFLSVPTCITGVVLALWLTGTTINVQSFIGLIVLVGIAVSNGIVMVDFINQLVREEGRPLESAVRDGALARMRPVLMTTAVTILAMLPMALGLGEGGELQAPMARVVIGGLLSSTLITLYLVPIVYRFIGRRRQTAAPVPAEG
jgi:HAE1 family hydrophobic/amphiphilic exporter-1